MRYVSGSMGIGALAVGGVFVNAEQADMLPVVGVVVILSLAVALLSTAARFDRLGPLFVYGVTALMVVSGFAEDPAHPASGLRALPVMVAMGGMMLGADHAIRVGMLGGGGALVALLMPISMGASNTEELVAHLLTVLITVMLTTIVVAYFMSHASRAQKELAEKVADLDFIAVRSAGLGKGDLRRIESVDSAVRQQLSDTIDGLRGVVHEIQSAAGEVDTTATTIARSSEAINRGATTQASAVEQTRHILASLLQSSGNIADAARSTLSATEANAQNFERITERTRELADVLSRINDLVEVMHDISTKSEVLALNAALEGQRAGSAGAGFTLIARNMQQLAERTIKALADVQELTADIQEQSALTMMVTEQGTATVGEANEAAKRIREVTSHQRVALEEVVRAMDDVLRVSQENSEQHASTQQQTEELVRLSKRLGEVVEGFRL